MEIHITRIPRKDWRNFLEHLICPGVNEYGCGKQCWVERVSDIETHSSAFVMYKAQCSSGHSFFIDNMGAIKQRRIPKKRAKMDYKLKAIRVMQCRNCRRIFIGNFQYKRKDCPICNPKIYGPDLLILNKIYS